MSEPGRPRRTVLEPVIEGPVPNRGAGLSYYGHCPEGDYSSARRRTPESARQAVLDHIRARHEQKAKEAKLPEGVDRHRWTRNGGRRFRSGDVLPEDWVLVTGRGARSHRSTACPTLDSGRDKAQAAGHHLAQTFMVPSDVAARLVEPCATCQRELVTGDLLPLQRPKAVEVHVKGQWLPGFLKAWQRLDDGSWKAHVNWWEGPGRQHMEWLAADLVRPRHESRID